MIWQLIKRDPAWKMLPWLTIPGVVFGLLVPANIVPALFPAFLGLFVAMKIEQRATLFEAALPVDGRRFLQARLVAMLCCAWVPIFGVIAGVMIRGTRPNGRLLVSMAGVGVALSLALSILQTIRLPDLSAKKRDQAAVFATLAGINVFVAVAFSTQTFLLFIATCAVLGIGWLIHVWPRVPLAFQTAPVRVRGSRTRTTAFGASWVPAWAVLPLLRALFPWRTCIWLGFAAFFPLVGNGYFPLCYLPAYFSASAPGLRWLATLPLSRRKQLLLILFPWFAILGSAWLFQTKFDFSDARTRLLTVHAGARRQPDFAVGFPYWLRTGGDIAPTVTAPSGETYRPPVQHLWIGTFYDPYAFGDRSSTEFREWQFERASTKIYGHPIPLSQAAQLEKQTAILDRPGIQFLRIALYAADALMILCFIAFAQWGRFLRISVTARKVIAISGTVTPIIVMAFGPLSMPPRLHGMSAMGDVTMLRLSGMMPAQPMAQIAIVLLILGGLCVLLDREFREAEPGARSPMEGKPDTP